MNKEIYGFISLIFVFLSAFPYMVTVFQGKTKPHLFSWIIWTIPTAIVFAGQAVSNAGAGGWATGLTLLANLIILAQCVRNSDKRITRSDWVFLIAGLMAIPLWLLTKDPLYSIILVTLIDILAYGPTIRKSWNAPYEENVFGYIMLLPKHIASLSAMDSFSFTNTLFPIAMIIINGAFFVFLILRRIQLGKKI